MRFETLEVRSLLAVDFVSTSLHGTTYAAAGGLASVAGSWWNAGDTALPENQVLNLDLLFSRDSHISQADTYYGGSSYLNHTFDPFQEELWDATDFRLPDPGDPFYDGDGYYYFGFMLDPDNYHAESNETNNANVGLGIDIHEIYIYGTGADFVGTAFSAGEVSASVGTSLVQASVKNEGVVAGSFTVNFYLDADGTIDASDALIGSAQVSDLAAGDTANINETFSIPGAVQKFLDGSGAYRIGMIIVADGAEAVGSNNSNVGEGFDSAPMTFTADSRVGLADLPATEFRDGELLNTVLDAIVGSLTESSAATKTLATIFNSVMDISAYHNQVKSLLASLTEVRTMFRTLYNGNVASLNFGATQLTQADLELVDRYLVYVVGGLEETSPLAEGPAGLVTPEGTARLAALKQLVSDFFVSGAVQGDPAGMLARAAKLGQGAGDNAAAVAAGVMTTAGSLVSKFNDLFSRALTIFDLNLRNGVAAVAGDPRLVDLCELGQTLATTAFSAADTEGARMLGLAGKLAGVRQLGASLVDQAITHWNDLQTPGLQIVGTYAGKVTWRIFLGSGTIKGKSKVTVKINPPDANGLTTGRVTVEAPVINKKTGELTGYKKVTGAIRGGYSPTGHLTGKLTIKRSGFKKSGGFTWVFQDGLLTGAFRDGEFSSLSLKRK